MRVPSNLTANTMISEMSQLSASEVQLQTEVSTGIDVSEPSDDPSSFGEVMLDQAQTQAISQYQTNASTALNVSNETLSVLQSMDSLADQASQIGVLGTGSSAAASMSSYATEINGLINEMVQLGNTQYNNSYIFAGTATASQPYTTTVDPSTGAITTVNYVGNTSQAAIPISSSTNIAVGSSGATNQGLATYMNDLIALRDALNSGDTTQVTAAASNLSSSENTITNEVADQSAAQTQIQVVQTQQTSLTTQLSKTVSDDTSTDLASTEVQLTQAQNAYQAAVETSADFLQKNILAYLPVE